jgi:BAI1-associated protein 3
MQIRAKINVYFIRGIFLFTFFCFSFIKFNFSEHIYSIFDSELASIIKPVVIEICSTKEGNIDNFQHDDQTIATKLFELYRELKRFSDQGLEYYYGEYEFHMRDYSRWFTAGIDKWCKASLFNATSRINKAIEVDNLRPELKESKRSSSAIDTMQILYSVKAFWERLQWPDANKEAEIAKHVAGDLCRFAIDYFEKFSEKLQKSEAMNITGIFKVPIEMAIAVANFNYISTEIQTLVKELTDGKVADTSSIELIVGNMLSHLDNTISQLLETTLKKSTDTLQKLMLEGAKHDNNRTGEDLADRLMTYIEDMLSTLVDDLPEKSFEVAKSIVWSQILQIFSEVIQVSLARQQPPAFFTNLRRILSILKEIFKFSVDTADAAMIKKVERIDYLLECYGLNTSRLIHQYYKERYELQLQINKQPFNPYGVLSVYCFFVKNTLKLEILNARNLIPIGPNKKCDSFIKVHLIPDKYFSTQPSCKTKVQQNTHFPLYDEIFEFELTDEQRRIDDAIIFFNIKDKYLLGSNECIAEAFLAFRDIPEYTMKDNLKQIHLTLTRLQCDGESSF